MTSRDIYDKQRNANLYICNNANPFLISPYAPSQISQTTGNTILAADTIKSYTPSATIKIQSPMNFTSGNALSINGNQVYTNSIYNSSSGGDGAAIYIDNNSPPNIQFNFKISPSVIADTQINITNNSTIFMNGTGDYQLEVKGAIITSNLQVSDTFTVSSIHASTLNVVELITTSSLQATALISTNALTVDTLMTTSSLQATALISTNALTVDTLLTTSSLQATALISTNALIVDTLLTTSSLQATALISTNALTVDTLLTTSSLQATALISTNALTVDTLLTTSSLQATALISTNALTVDTLLTTSSLQATALISTNALTVDTLLTTSSLQATALIRTDNIQLGTNGGPDATIDIYKAIVGTAGTVAGYLPITVNGSTYKIQLYNP